MGTQQETVNRYLATSVDTILEDEREHYPPFRAAWSETA
jgi:hypothetical protein